MFRSLYAHAVFISINRSNNLLLSKRGMRLPSISENAVKTRVTTLRKTNNVRSICAYAYVSVSSPAYVHAVSVCENRKSECVSKVHNEYFATSHHFLVGRVGCEYLVNSPSLAKHGTK